MIAQLSTLSSSATPSPFHQLLKLLDERGQLLRCYTQNIDNLEERAGLSTGIPSWAQEGKGKGKAKPKVKQVQQVKELEGGGVGESSASVDDSASESAGPSSSANTLASSNTNAKSRIVPRCIPLHGTLDSLICQRCSHSIPLASQLLPLSQGHSVPCPQCTSAGSARRLEGKRDRGVGMMRPSVVLYGEEHLNGEGVGEWLVFSSLVVVLGFVTCSLLCFLFLLPCLSGWVGALGVVAHIISLRLGCLSVSIRDYKVK